LAKLGWIAPIQEATMAMLKNVSLGIMTAALLIGAGIIIRSLSSGMRANRAPILAQEGQT
ncbi:MAG: hypothetical protein PHX10_02425, partial [Gallionellaceae bacterium]|nr:hypothetical protein [Gallionellaceae bacterium]